MKVYKDIKRSKFKWFDVIPSQWGEGRISYLFKIGRGRVISELELNPDGMYPVYSSQTKNNGCMGYIDTYDFDAEILTWTTDGANAGSVFLRSGKFNCTNVCGTLSPKVDLSLKYYLYYLQSLTPFYKRPDTNGAKIMNNEMAQIYCLMPSLVEQYQIVSYLDHETFLVDNLISKQEKLIELLKEKRQSIIYEAITKGLDPSSKLKQSGVAWIGKVPKNWSLKRLKFLFKIRKDIAGQLGYDVLSVTQKGLKIRDLDNLKGQLSMDYSKYQLVDPGDFVMNHMDLLTGFIDISKWEGVTSPDYRVFSLVDLNCNDRYYLYLFQLCYTNKIFFGLGQGVSQLGRWRLSAEQFNEFVLPVPPLEEQNNIVAHLDKELSVIENLIGRQEQSILKLLEYRQSLVLEAVTGKVDLREWKPNSKKQLA